MDDTIKPRLIELESKVEHLEEELDRNKRQRIYYENRWNIHLYLTEKGFTYSFDAGWASTYKGKQVMIADDNSSAVDIFIRKDDNHWHKPEGVVWGFYVNEPGALEIVKKVVEEWEK